jgi:hypothetical protein
MIVPLDRALTRRGVLAAGAGLAVAGCSNTLQLTQDRVSAIKSVLPVVSFDESLDLQYSSGTIMIGVLPPTRIMHARQLVPTAWGMNAHAASVLETVLRPHFGVSPAVTLTPGLVPREGATTQLPDAMIRQRLAALPDVAMTRREAKADAILVVATVARNGLPHRGLQRAPIYGAALITVNHLIAPPADADLSVAYVTLLYSAQTLELLGSIFPNMGDNQPNMFGTPVPRRTLPIVWRGEPWGTAREPQRSMLRDAAHGLISQTLPSALATMGLVPVAPAA